MARIDTETGIMTKLCSVLFNQIERVIRYKYTVMLASSCTSLTSEKQADIRIRENKRTIEERGEQITPGLVHFLSHMASCALENAHLQNSISGTYLTTIVAEFDCYSSTNQKRWCYGECFVFNALLPPSTSKLYSGTFWQPGVLADRRRMAKCFTAFCSCTRLKRVRLLRTRTRAPIEEICSGCNSIHGKSFFTNF